MSGTKVTIVFKNKFGEVRTIEADSPNPGIAANDALTAYQKLKDGKLKKKED